MIEGEGLFCGVPRIHVPEACQGVEVVIGVDEAGRGPVLGSLVYCAAFWPASMNEEISALGFDDSKQLKDGEREKLFKGIKGMFTKGLKESACYLIKTAHTRYNFLSRGMDPPRGLHFIVTCELQLVDLARDCRGASLHLPLLLGIPPSPRLAQVLQRLSLRLPGRSLLFTSFSHLQCSHRIHARVGRYSSKSIVRGQSYFYFFLVLWDTTKGRRRRRSAGTGAAHQSGRCLPYHPRLVLITPEYPS